MVETALSNIESAGVEESVGVFTADAGYFSEDNMNYLDEHENIKASYIATGRLKHHESVPDAPKGRPPKDQTPRQKMARRLRTKKGKAEYARRKALAEPPFGQIKQCRGFRQFSMRGLKKMQGEWTLVCLTHNLLKLFRSEVPAMI